MLGNISYYKEASVRTLAFFGVIISLTAAGWMAAYLLSVPEWKGIVISFAGVAVWLVLCFIADRLDDDEGY